MSAYGAVRCSRPCGEAQRWYGLRRVGAEARAVAPPRTELVVVLQPQMRDQFFSPQMAECVLQLDELDEQIVLGIQTGRGHRRLEVEAEPLLDAQAAEFGRALDEIEEEHEIKHDGRR